MNLPLVSVVLPVYNTERYLAQALDSILNQTFTDFELIALNDGSTDHSLNILESCKDERIRIIDKKNEGVAKTCQLGLELAKGELVWRHDADDISDPDQLRRQIEFLTNHPEFDLVGTQIAFMTESGKIANNFRQPKDDYFEGFEFKVVEPGHFNPYSPITHATVLMRKSVIKELGGYRTEFITSEDTDLWLRFLEKYEGAVLNKCGYFVRLNPTSATQKHQSGTNYFRELAKEFANERLKIGTDPLMRGETIPEKAKAELALNEVNPGKGKVLRNDLFDYYFRIYLDARDFKEIAKVLYFSIRDGWKLPETWKGIIFPLLPGWFINMGVKLKRYFR